MTHAFGGGGDLTLATLYVPVKPEIRGLHEEMVRVGEQAGRSLAQGMNSSGLTQIGSAMALGLQRSMPMGLSHAFGELHSQLDHLGQGALTAQTAFDRYTNSMRLSGEAANRTHGEETKLMNLRNQGTNVAAQITASEAMIAEHYRRGGESSRECQKEEQNLQNLRTRGNNLATQMVVQQGQLENAQALHTQRVQESTTAHERYNEALQQSHSHLNLGAIGTAALTGAVTGLTFAAVNLASDGLSAVLHGFEGIVKAGAGVVESVIGVGQHFQDLNRQVTLFTTESGSALKDMQDGMRSVYAGLDVPADRLGETFGVLHAQFGFTGEGLDKVARHLTELGARFGGINIREFSAAMHQFGIEGVEPVDRALGQLIYDSQKYGITVQSLQNSMVQMGPIWDALDVNYNSAAMAVSRIEQLGDPARRVMLGLSATAKEMAKGPDPKGTFKQYMQDVLQTGANLEATGGTAMADAFAQSEFSVRNWAILKQTYGIMQDAMNNVGAEGDNIDLENLIVKTRTLHERFTLFFHDVEARLAPLGLNIVEHIGGALDTFQHWFDTHQTEIIGKIKEWGDVFIDNIPKIQHFIGEAVKFIGDFVTFSVKSFGFVGEAIGLLFGNKDMEELGRKITNFDMRPLTDKIGNEIEYGLHIDTGALKTWWDNDAIPGLVKNQPKIEIPTDLKTPDGKSLLDEKQMQEWVKGKGEKIGGALIDGIEKAAKERMPGWLKWTLEHGSWLVGGIDDAFDDDTPENRKKYPDVNPAPRKTQEPDPPPTTYAPGSPWSSGASVDSGPQMPAMPGYGLHWEDGKGWVPDPHPAHTSGFTEPVNNAPTSVALAGKYDPDPHAHETPSAPPGIGAPTWPGMPKSSSRGSGKDPKLQAQERQDRLDNARDSKDDADDAYTDAVNAAKIAEEKDTPLIEKYKGWVAASRVGSTLREGYQKDLDAATQDLTKARHAATHALHAKDRAGRALDEAEMKSEEPEKGGGDDANLQKLGQSIIPGLMQEVGFGDIFGKAPNEWGIFKMLGGALQWGLKAANAFGAAGIKLGPHGLTMPSTAGPGNSAAAPIAVGPQEVSPFGSQRGAPPGPTNQAPKTMWGYQVPAAPKTMWGYQVPAQLQRAWSGANTPSQIARGTALASATLPNTPPPSPVGTVPSGGYAVNPATAAGTLRLAGTTTDAFNDAQRRGVEANAPLYAKGLDTKGYGNSKGLPQWAIDIGAKFGLAPSTYPEGGTLHQAGYAMDFAPIPGNSDPAGSMDRFSTYVKQNLGPQTLELIHDDPKTGQKWGMAGARPVGPGTNMPGYFSSDWGGHQDHVHWATDVPPVQGYQTGGLVGFDDGGSVPSIAPWDTSHSPTPARIRPWIPPPLAWQTMSELPGALPHAGTNSVPIVRYPEGGTHWWDNSRASQLPSVGPQVRYSPEVGDTSHAPPSSGRGVTPSPSGHHPWFSGAWPAGTQGQGSGYKGAGFQPGGDWVKSTETTAIGSHYKIKSGDTLSDIAQRSGLNISDIQKANNITNPDMINADTILKLPGGRGWFGTPSSGGREWSGTPSHGIVGAPPSSGFSTQPPIKLTRTSGPPAVTPMSHDDPGYPNTQSRGGNGSILANLLDPVRRAWLGFGDTDGWHEKEEDHPGEDTVAGFGGLNPLLRKLLKGFDQGGAAGLADVSTDKHMTASKADIFAQKRTESGMYNPRWWGKYLPHGNINPNVLLDTSTTQLGGGIRGETLDNHWPFRWPRKVKHGGLYPQAGAWSSHHDPEPFAPWDTAGHANGGVVGFENGGEVGGNNFYKRWYPRSQTPTPTASTPMLRPDNLGGLLGATDTHPSAPASTAPSAVRPWGVMTKPAADATHPLQGFRSLADEHRATGFGRLSRAVSSFTGVLPDVALDYDTLRHWGQHTGMEQTGAVLDTASMIPGLGSLLGAGAGALGRGAAHGITALDHLLPLGREFRIGSRGAGAALQKGFEPTKNLNVAPPLDAADEWLVKHDPLRQQYQKYADFVKNRFDQHPQGDYPDLMPFEQWAKLQNEADVGAWNIPAKTVKDPLLDVLDTPPTWKPPSTVKDLDELRSRVMKTEPDPSMLSTDYLMRVFNKPWGQTKAFQMMQPDVTRGIHDAFAGNQTGLTDEMVDALSNWTTRSWSWTEEEFKANTPEKMRDVFHAFGVKLGSMMVHSDPTENTLYRGVAMSPERSQALRKGEILTMPRPVSLTRGQPSAADAALYRSPWQHNYDDLMDLPEREGRSGVTPGTRGALKAAKIDPESSIIPPWDPVLYHYEPGTQIADLEDKITGWDEQLTMGKFKITDVDRPEQWGLTVAYLQQIGLLPGQGFAFGGVATTDTVPAMLTPGEVVLNKRAVDMIGLDNALGINALGLAAGGEVPVSAAPNINLSSDFKQQSLTNALGGISAIAAGLGADLNPKQWNGLLTAPQQRQSAVHYDNSIHITGNTIADPKQQQQAQQDRWNSRFETTTGGLPMPSVGAP